MAYVIFAMPALLLRMARRCRAYATPLYALDDDISLTPRYATPMICAAAANMPLFCL